MGIINEYRESSQKFGVYQEPVKENIDTKSQKILDLTYLKKLISDVLSYHMTKQPAKELKGYRRWSYVQSWRLQNILGHVDTPTWVFMLESTVDWCIDTRSATQPNGKWELIDFEIKIEQVDRQRNAVVGRDREGNPQTEMIKEAVQYLVIGFQFVDVRGNKDLQYEMGRPKAYSDQSITPEMLKEVGNGWIRPSSIHAYLHTL